MKSSKQLSASRPSAQPFPLQALPSEMVEKVVENMPAKELSSFGKTAHFSRNIAAPFLSKIINLRDQINALDVTTGEGKEKAGELCKAISQFTASPSGHSGQSNGRADQPHRQATQNQSANSPLAVRDGNRLDTQIANAKSAGVAA